MPTGRWRAGPLDHLNGARDAGGEIVGINLHDPIDTHAPPGAYRVEACRRARPWILSNRVYLR
ncbi:MAG: hypothetical protein WA005_08175 [Candidatus Binataceae bacterium]